MSSDNENGFDSTSSRTRKRMLPSVAEIARELSRRTGADAASILTTARKVCADELVRIKEGHESVPVDVLVERAREMLELETRQAGAAFTFEPLPPLPDAPPSVPAPRLAEGADPFGETMGKLDLRWEGDEVGSPDGQVGEAPHLGGVPPLDEVPPAQRPAPFEMSFPLPDEAPGGAPEAGPSPASLPPFAFNLDEPFAPEPADASAAPPLRDPIQPPAGSRSKLPFFLAIGLLFAAAGGAAWYFLVGPAKPSGPPPPLSVQRKPKAPAAVATGEVASPAGQPSTSQPPVQATALAAVAPVAPVASVPAVPTSPAAPAPSAPAKTALPANPDWVKSGGAPQVPAGGAAQPTAGPRKKAADAPPRPTAAPSMSVAPEPVPVEPKAKPEPKTKPEPAAEKAIRAEPKKVEKAPSAAQVQVRAGTLVTPGWTAAPVFVVHFSSFQEKARAEKHAAVLAKELGLPVRAVQVDLGDKGTWYRSVAGEFQTAEEALALRATLLEKGTQGVGLVYRMTGKK